MAKYFFLSLVINFVVLAGVGMLFEYFDSGDDPIYSGREAIKHFITAIPIAATIVMVNRKGKDRDSA